MDHFIIPKAAVVVICHDPKSVRSWCNEMCSGLWRVEPADVDVNYICPEDTFNAHVVYFRREVDCMMFQSAFKADIWLANHLVN